MILTKEKHLPLYLTNSLVSFAQFLSIFRLLVVGLMLLMEFLKFGTFGIFSPALFIGLCVIHAIFAATDIASRRQEKISASEQLANSILDITFLTTLTGISGGTQTGIGILTLIVMGLGAGLCSKTGWKILVLWSIIATTVSEYIHFTQYQSTTIYTLEDYLPTFFIGIAYVITGAVANYLGFSLREYDTIKDVHQKKLNLQLKINELMLQEMEEGVIVIDQQGNILQMNRHTELMLLFDTPERQINIHEISSRLYNHFVNWQTGGNNKCEFRSGQNRSIFHGRFSAVPDSEGLSVIFIEDYEKVRRQAQRLKMSALGMLTANIAHEIRNPLSAIHQSAELLQCKDEKDVEPLSPEIQKKLATIILEHTSRIDKIIRDVSVLDKRDRVKKESLSVVKTISNIVDSFLSIQSSQDDVNYSLDIFVIEGQEDLLIEFDRSHFIQIINNLINNAWSFCKKQSSSIRIFVAFHPKSKEVEIKIIDDGPGVSDNNANKIFEPFFTTRPQGTGIGLFVSRELCEANHGTLSLHKNAPGAFFSLTAPGLLSI